MEPNIAVSKASKLVAWGKPEKSPMGTVLRYRSKCGLFVITRHEYVLPFACVSYKLHFVCAGKTEHEEHDRLGDAKESAKGMLEEGPEQGYVLSPLPVGFNGKKGT